MKKRFKISLAVFLIAALTACAHKTKNAVEWDILRHDIEALATVATRCLEQQTTKSDACIDFVRRYRSGGADDIKVFSENVTELLKQDLEAGLVSTQHFIEITNAFLFVGGYPIPQ